MAYQVHYNDHYLFNQSIQSIAFTSFQAILPKEPTQILPTQFVTGNISRIDFLSKSNIEKVILQHFGLKYEDLLNPGRERWYMYPRQVFVYLLNEHTKMILKDIGGIFGRDHSFAIHCCKTIKNLLEINDDKVCYDMEIIRKMLIAAQY